MKIAIKRKAHKNKNPFDVEKISGNFCYKLLLDIYYKQKENRKKKPLKENGKLPFFYSNMKKG